VRLDAPCRCRHAWARPSAPLTCGARARVSVPSPPAQAMGDLVVVAAFLGGITAQEAPPPDPEWARLCLTQAHAALPVTSPRR
jgi:hypothetical protein